jgi:tyrosyl-tRNA synthetase
MRLPDEAMDSWFSLLAVPRPPAESSPRDTKRALARGIVERFHGADAAAAAEQHFDALFVRHDVPDDVAEHAFSANGGPVFLPALLAAAFSISSSEARRLLAQGGVKLDGEVLAADPLELPAEQLDGRVLQAGKRRFCRLRLQP